ncbi:MAG: class I SAM-dependent methyltransferase [Ignavibacteriales bacterium]|nr:class I SAM-dependent methyltransferase [Ignavibacteriales bacterium]
MKMTTNYNNLSPDYDLRYKVNPMEGINKALLNIISENKFSNILEIGCGTGHWLKKLDHGLNKFGVDFSAGMLKEAQRNINKINLIRADANSLPFASSKFDFIFCVNAIHQFENKKEFIRDSSRFLKPDGVLTIIGLDPGNKNDNWYIYDFFEGTLEKDLNRFPSFELIELWMKEAGLRNVKINIVENIINDMTGEEVFNDTFLLKNQSSQLASLSDKEYSAGINKIKEAVEINPKMIFPVRLSFISVSGKNI